MTNERNKETLVRAIAELPSYPAPATLWDKLEADLQEAEQFEQMSKAARQLPLLVAPETSWDHIVRELDQPKKNIRHLPFRWVAAVFLLLLASAGLMRAFERPETAVTVREERNDPSLLVADWDTEEALIAELIALYKERQPSGFQNEERAWLNELEELHAARDELKEAMNRFGRDAQMIRQLAKIERERAAVLKKMAQQI